MPKYFAVSKMSVTFVACSSLYNLNIIVMRMVLSSIAQCRKALAWLTEAGLTEGTHVELRGVACPVRVQDTNGGQDTLPWHQLVVLDHNRLQCQTCGKVFRSKHLELTPVDRIQFARLDPRIPFVQGVEQLSVHS